MHFIDPLKPPAGKQTPPFTAQSSRALQSGQPGHTGNGERLPEAHGPHRRAPGLPSLSSSWGGSWGTPPSLLGCFKPPGFLCGAEEGMPQAREKPRSPSDAGQPGTDTVKVGHACHLVERSGHSAGSPSPAVPVLMQGGGISQFGGSQAKHTPQKSGRGLTLQQGQRCSCSSQQSRINPFQKAARGCWP